MTMKALIITSLVACSSFCSALTQSWSISGNYLQNANTRRVVPDGTGNVVLVTDSYSSVSGSLAQLVVRGNDKIGWQRYSTSGGLLGEYNASTGGAYVAADAAVCGGYLGVLASTGSVLSVFIFPLSGGAPTVVNVSSTGSFVKPSIKATASAFYVSYSNGLTTLGRINTSGTMAWTQTSATVDGGVLGVPTDSSGNDWPAAFGMCLVSAPPLVAGAEIAGVYNSAGALQSQATLSYQPNFEQAPQAYSAACLDATGQYVFALGSETLEYVYNGQNEGEYMPNVEVYPSGQSLPSGAGTYSFPVEDTFQTGPFGVAIASRPVSTASLAVYGLVTDSTGKYDSFAATWDPVGHVLGSTPTVFLHGSSWPTLVAADSNYAYFAGGGILYEHVASTFALNASLTAAGSTDLQAIGGMVFLVGGNFMTCYNP
jgi:hypothetical protein